MKSMLKILTRYVFSATGVALFLLVLNGSAYAAYIIKNSNTNEYSGKHLYEIAASLTKENGDFILDEEGKQIIQQQYEWAMLLGADGTVIWSEKLPEDVPHSYTITEIASFTRWYLQDYPVYVWEHPEGLLVLGLPKGSLWKHRIEMPEASLRNFLEWLVGTLILNVIAAVLLSVLSGLRFFLSFNSLAKGIESMARNIPVKLSTRGVLGDLAIRLNETSTQLQQQEIDLQKRDTLRTTWIAGVSHDIRTPLSMVMGYASELEENPTLPQAEREQAGIIRRQSEKIKTLVNDLNLASKLEYDMQPIQITRVYPVELVRNVVADFLNSGLKPSYNIEFDIEKEAQGIVVAADEELIRRAVVNLIHNSIHHNPDGCVVTISVKINSPYCSILIADNGTGFPEKVIEEFKDPPKPVALQSHGLGLTIVRQIIKVHSGIIELHNLPTHGCETIIHLPISENQQLS